MLLDVEHISKRFGGLLAIHDLNLSVYEGEILGIIGPNGAGKTTFFSIISGFQKPTEGRVIFRGKRIEKLKPSEIAGLGLVRTFQNADVFQKLSVLDNLLMGMQLTYKPSFWGVFAHTKKYSRREKESVNRAKEILNFVGLHDLMHETAGSLPHGHLRTLGVAMAWAAKPKLLLLDEPATGMHPREIHNMISLIQKIRETGITIIVVEHNMRVIKGISNRIIVFDFGKKIAEGKPEEVMKDKNVISAYLGTRKHHARD